MHEHFWGVMVGSAQTIDEPSASLAAALAHGSPAPNHRKARKCEPGADPGYQRAQCQQACHTKILYRGRGQLAALFAESGQIT